MREKSRSILEIKGEGIEEVEEIIRKIGVNKIKRKESSFSPENVLDLYCPSTPDIQHDFRQIKWTWDIGNSSYCISSHRPIVGKALVMGRELIHGEVKRYIDPMTEIQRDFNKSIAQILCKLDARIDRIDNEIENLEGQASKTKTMVDANQIISNPSLKKQKLHMYLHCFSGLQNLVDIGCRQVDLLDTFKEHGIRAHGVSTDEDSAKCCKQRGFDVERIDPIHYLERTDDNSQEGIFMDHFVEGVNPEYLAKMLNLCYKKLKHGYYLIIETANPLSVFHFVKSCDDGNNKMLMHPETLKLLLRSSCFREINVNFFSPISDYWLKSIPIKSKFANETEKTIVETYNSNIDLLNSIIFDAQDYAVIGKK